MEGENNKKIDDDVRLIEPLIQSLHIINELTTSKKEYRKSVFILIGVLIGCITIIVSVFIISVSFAPTDISVKNEAYSNSMSNSAITDNEILITTSEGGMMIDD